MLVAVWSASGLLLLLFGNLALKFGRFQFLPGGLDAASAGSHRSLGSQLSAKTVVLLVPSGRREEKVRLAWFFTSATPVITAVPP